MLQNKIKTSFFYRIVLPALLVFILFLISIFIYIIPAFESSMLKNKREMIAELTNSASSILFDYNKQYINDKITLAAAQKAAIEQVENLRYGEDRKDYFWITDLHPNMIVHPYRPELNGTDLTNYQDPEGKKLFVEFTKAVKSDGEGYVDYKWQWKDDSSKIVPKLSYVKLYEPWGWIIGTGIYIEDVREEIENLTSQLLYVSLAILSLIGLTLVYVGRQSFKIESERQIAEENLKESEGKYRALVEASTDGLIMILGGKIVYANNALIEMLGYDSRTANQKLYSMICNKDFSNLSGVEYFKGLLENGDKATKLEAQLASKKGAILDVILYTSEINFGERSGFTIIVKDISSSKRISKELGSNKERFQSLISNINIGVFRITLGKYGKFVEANPPAVKIFGFDDFDSLKENRFLDLFRSDDEQDKFFEKLLSKGIVKNSVLQVSKNDGSTSIVSVSAMLVKDDFGNDKFCDGIVEDITDRIKLNEERENLIVELQTSLKFLHQPLENFLKQTVSCNMNTTIQDAAKIITKNKYSAILIQAESGEFIGIVTDHDLRKRVIAEKIDTDKPIFKIMSSPLMTVSENSFVFEALMMMHDNSTRHLAVKNSQGNIIGLISSEELLMVDRQSSAYLLREIEMAENVDELSAVKEKLPRLVKILIDSGARTKNITKIITSIFDSIVAKIIDFAKNELGDPPAEFSFVALGSAGRKEQTLISDQDNAIIIENLPQEQLKDSKKYFDALADFVCNGLKECGYEFCTGLAMANNTKWTQPLNIWKDYFHKWIANSSQQDLIDISIYFDFRHIYGNIKLAEELRTHIGKVSEGQAGFFQHLTKNCLLHKPPLGILGKLVLESKGDRDEIFDIKLAAMPISDFARIYALKYNLTSTNTLERLSSLLQKGVLKKNSYEEIVQAYNFLMQLRFKHQAVQITSGNLIDNFIEPKKLTQVEIKTLKNTFSQIQAIQKRLSYDFTGEAI